jgi:hypothetical protein
VQTLEELEVQMILSVFVIFVLVFPKFLYNPEK